MSEAVKIICVAIVPALISYIATQKECNSKIESTRVECNTRIAEIKADYEGKITAIKADYEGKINQYDKSKETDMKYKFIERLMSTKQVNRAMQEQFCEYFKNKNIFEINE